MPHNTSELQLSSKLESAISLVTVNPSLNLRAIELIMRNSKAVVLAGYGAGNLPTNNSEFMHLVEGAIRHNVIVVIKTQCHRGSVDDVYETGRLMT